MTDTQALIARLEAATGPDRELDAAIAVATTPGMFAESGFVGFTGEGDMEPPPAYTASIDAALTLVPEGAWWGLDANGEAVVSYEKSWRDEFGDVEYGQERAFGSAPTPALAIVSAALRAKGDA